MDPPLPFFFDPGPYRYIQLACSRDYASIEAKFHLGDIEWRPACCIPAFDASRELPERAKELELLGFFDVTAFFPIPGERHLFRPLAETMCNIRGEVGGTVLLSVRYRNVVLTRCCGVDLFVAEQRLNACNKALLNLQVNHAKN